MDIVQDLRSWLADLDRRGELVVAEAGVPLRFGILAVLERWEGQKACYFPNPEGHPIPIVGGTIARRDWVARALGVEPGQVLERFGQAVARPTPWEVVPSEAAPVQEVVHDKDIDLRVLLPVITCHENDGGPYITSGLVHGLNLQTGKQNLSINRLQLHTPDKLGVLLLPRDLYAYFQYAESVNQPLPVTITIGHDPLTELASQAIAPRDQCELEIAGTLRGRPQRVVQSVSNGVYIPADAEIALEGRILPGVRALEGPFGEFPKYYTGVGLAPVIQVERVTHRRQPIYRVNNPSGPENVIIGGVPREASLLERLRLNFPNVLDVRLTAGGLGRYHLVVQMRKKQYGEAKNVIACAFGCHYDLKLVVVVDEDIDLDVPEQVEWALATRFEADRDLVMLPGALGSKLDPSTRGHGLGAKLGMDATAYLGDEQRFRVARVPRPAGLDPDRSIQDTTRAYREYVGR